MACALCADIGTSSLKTAVIDQNGKVLAYSRQRFGNTSDTNSSDSVAKEWLPALKASMDEIFTDGSLNVDAICISGNGPTLVNCSGHALLWNQKIPESDSALSGTAGKSLFIPRLMAYKKLHAYEWNASQYIFSGPEFLIYSLTGNAVTILPEERYTQAYWNEDTLKEAGFSQEDISKIPPFARPSSLAGRVNASVESFLSHTQNNIKEGLPVYCGAPDFIAALIGSNTLKPGLLCDRAGSSEGINLCTDKPLSAPGVRTLPSVIPGLWNASVLIPDSGIRFSSYKNRFEETSGFSVGYSELVDAAISSDGSQAILDQGKYLMLQIAMQVRDGIQTLLSLAGNEGQPLPSCLTLTGGQAQSDGFTQMKSSVTGMEIKVLQCNDAELLGDAVLAFCGMGIYSDIQTAAEKIQHVSKVFAPGGDLG
jgi:sugar (pentulose or hexulose) kinase